MFQEKALFWLSAFIVCTLPRNTYPDPICPSATREVSEGGWLNLFGAHPSSTSSNQQTPHKLSTIISKFFGFGKPSTNNSQIGWPYEDIEFNHPVQSPVDILTHMAVTKDLPVLDIVEPEQPDVKAKVYNSGHTVYIYVKEEPAFRPHLRGGPLREKYVFEQMHFHWGSEDIWGSEHFIDSESYSVEIHMVHYNSKYDTFATAAGKPDGLAVLTIFAEGQQKDNPLLEPLHQLLPSISVANTSMELNSVKAMQWPKSALTLNHEYYTYPGSLTTPPYSENVIFILLPKPIKLSTQQLAAFRDLHSEHHGKILENKRQLQPLHRRPIVRSTRVQ